MNLVRADLYHDIRHQSPHIRVTECSTMIFLIENIKLKSSQKEVLARYYQCISILHKIAEYKSKLSMLSSVPIRQLCDNAPVITI